VSLYLSRWKRMKVTLKGSSQELTKSTSQACKNVFRGCPKRGDHNELFYHEKVLCTYPPGISSYSATESGTTERVLRTRGFLCLELGTSNSMVPFNNSFLRECGAQFTFTEAKDSGSPRILIQGYSSRLPDTASYLFKFRADNFKHAVCGSFSNDLEKLGVLPLPASLVASGQGGHHRILKYSLRIKYKQPPIFID